MAKTGWVKSIENQVEVDTILPKQGVVGPSPITRLVTKNRSIPPKRFFVTVGFMPIVLRMFYIKSPLACQKYDVIILMTLILACGNAEYAVLASDRRLSINGIVCEEEANKAIILATEDARVTIAFTGLAKFGRFDTLSWLIDVIEKAATENRQIEHILNKIALHADRQINAISGLSNDHKRLTILSIGFIYTETSVELRCWKISNFEDQHGNKSSTAHPKFDVWVHSPSSGVILESAGYVSAIPSSNLDKLRLMLLKSTPVYGIEAKSYDIIQKAAHNKSLKQVIGKQSTVCRILRDNTQVMHCTYFSEFVDWAVFSASSIFAISSGTPMIQYSADFMIGPELPPAIVPCASE